MFVLVSTETEFENKLKELQAKHQEELGNGEATTTTAPPAASETTTPPTADAVENSANDARERKQAKARRKREKAKQAELERQARIEQETKDAGPSARQMELERMQQQLSRAKLKIEEVPSDGNCLYRAVAAQCDDSSDYTDIRAKCADSLQQHEEEFMPFCEYTDKVPTFDAYVNQVRNSSEWGGHLELRALSLALKRPIEVYSVERSEPLVLGHADDDEDHKEPIRLSYHLHYYALGEHYNQVVPSNEGDEQ